jgi:Fe2+ or Zn2+ uptake regulation protein
MKLVLDEEEIWVLECIKKAHLDRGFHIRDVIKKAKSEYGLSRSTVYEIIGYLEFHGLIKTNKSGNRELDKDIQYFAICPGCNKEIPGNEYFKEKGRAICEDCYLEGHQKIKFADPVAVRSKKLFRKQHGFEGTEGLTELQKEIYDFILEEGGATPEKISKLFKLTLQETSNQLAILRHCELLKWRKMGEEMYMVPFDS